MHRRTSGSSQGQHCSFLSALYHLSLLLYRNVYEYNLFHRQVSERISEPFGASEPHVLVNLHPLHMAPFLKITTARTTEQPACISIALFSALCFPPAPKWAPRGQPVPAWGAGPRRADSTAQLRALIATEG